MQTKASRTPRPELLGEEVSRGTRHRDDLGRRRLVGGRRRCERRKDPRHASRLEIEEACRCRKAEHLAREIVAGQRPAALAAERLQALCNAVLVAALALLVEHQPAAAEWNVFWHFALVAVAGGFSLIIANVWIPSAIARVWGTSYVAATWPVWRAISRLLTPLVAGFRHTDRLAQALTGRSSTSTAEPAPDGELRGAASEEQREARLDEDAREMIERVIQLRDAEVSQVMTPRTYMFSMRASIALEEAVKLAISSAHTRIPVYDKNRDEIVGILHMKDLLPELMKPPQERPLNVRDLLRPAHVRPRNQTARRVARRIPTYPQSHGHGARRIRRRVGPGDDRGRA